MTYSGNPLFPQADDKPQDSGYISLRPKSSTVVPPAEPAKPSAAPTTPAPANDSTNAALNLIRDKLARIYAEEPDVKEQQQKAAAAEPPSKHQAFMQRLQQSGKSLVEVQTAWHEYYAQLPDHEKHQVWQEFYQANERAQTAQRASTPTPQPYQPLRLPSPSLSQSFTRPQLAIPELPNPLPNLSQALRSIALPKRPTFSQPTRPVPVQPEPDTRSATEVRASIINKVNANGRLGVKHHLQSLTFGLAVGFITLVIALFGLFNEVVIAPFIQPGRTAGATPIIVDPSNIATTTNPEIIIPKINLEIPVDYTQTASDEATIQSALEHGVVHYPSTVMPGQNGNAAFFGHSSNNIFTPGKYKFAFVLLHELQPGDTFYLTLNGKAYIYKVFDREIVDPSDVSVLNNVPGHAATVTLITCDPPGTALRRLVVVADQISPDPATNGSGANTAATDKTVDALPDNGPSLLQRLWNAIF